MFFLRVLTSEGGSVCLGVAILCTVMCFFGVHNELSKPFVLFCFFLSLPPSPPLSYCSPPTGCAFVTFATRAMAQNAIKTMHHSQTMEVLYPLAPISHSPPFPLYILLPPCVGNMNNLSKQMASIHQSMSHFQNHSCQLQNYIVVCKIIEDNTKHCLSHSC